MLDVLATGYPSFDSIFPVSHSPEVGETALIQSLPSETNVQFGGCGPNVAVGLSRLGFKTGLAMILGDDDLSKTYKAHLAQHGIDQSEVVTLSSAKTSRSFLFCSPDGEYQNFFYAGAADEWHGQLQALPQTRYALVTVGPYHYNHQFVEKAVSADIPVVWQMKADVRAYPADSIHLFLEASEIILMNHIEAEFVRASSGVNTLNDLLRGKTRVIVVTHGASGVNIITKNQSHLTSIGSIETEVKDTTGAGDGFTTGFLAGVLRGHDTLTAARMGIVVATFVLQELGCQTNLPDWNQMQIKYEEYFGPL